MPVTYWYQQRALQLREKYDYLILSFSGGRDSHNVLHSFIKNGIHLDEVWCDWPLTHTHGKIDNDPNDRSADNMPSEWTYSIKPELDRLAVTHPNIKITITDSTQMLDNEDQEDTLIVSQYAYYATIKRWRTLDAIVQERSKKHKRVGVIAGIEKPECSIIENCLTLSFNDTYLQIKSDHTGDCVRDVEYFYWSPDLPELLRSQGHAILNYFKVDPSMRNLYDEYTINPNHTLNQTNKQTVSQGNQWRSMINYAIYPYWNPNTLQVDKCINVLYNNEFYNWLSSHTELRALQSHRSALDNSFKMIDHKFFIQDATTNRILNYKPCTTKFFPIGKIHDQF